MSQYFNYDTDPKLACSCCGDRRMKPGFLRLLDGIREEVGEPLTIVSGYRCPKHNDKVSSTGPNGPHTTGKAVDIKSDSRLRFKIVEAAMKQGINRIGIARTFIHIDDLDELDGFPADRIWSY